MSAFTQKMKLRILRRIFESTDFAIFVSRKFSPRENDGEHKKSTSTVRRTVNVGLFIEIILNMLFVHQNFWYSLVYQSPCFALISLFFFYIEIFAKTSQYGESIYEKQQMNYYFPSSIKTKEKTNFEANWAVSPLIRSFSFLIS